jgi:hypothetical protein
MTEQPTVGRDEVEVAHEALIRHWPRLRQWLETDRADLLLRESIREAAQEWDQHGRDESYLAHRGRRLEAAEALRHHSRVGLNTQEQAYLDAAVALREREAQEREVLRQRELEAARQLAEEAEARREAESVARREAEQRATEQTVAARRLQQRLLVAAALGVVALLAALGAFWGFRQAAEQQAVAESQRIVAEEQRGTAVAAAGTAEAESTRADAARIEAEGERRRADEQAAVAEAERAAAVAAAETAEAERVRADEQAGISLAQALAAQAIAETERGEHARGALLARQAYLVDEMNGNPVRGRVGDALRDALSVPFFSTTLRGHEDLVNSVAFAPDGQIVLEGGEHAVLSIAFAPDGRTLASGGRDGTVRVWLAPETLVDLVCTEVRRNLTLDEWHQFVGDPEQVPYQSTCPNLPPGEGVMMATPAIGTPSTPSAALVSSGTPVNTLAVTPVPKRT